MILCTVYSDAESWAPRSGFYVQVSIYYPDDGMAKHLQAPRYVKIVFRHL